MTQSRKTQVSLQDTVYYHCISRCVRRAFLCGEDKYSGQSFEHRRQWVVDRIRQLSTVFSIDVAAYAVLSNHYHLVLHVDVDDAKTWSHAEIVNRWQQIYLSRPVVDCYLENKTDAIETKEAIVIIEKWRARLLLKKLGFDNNNWQMLSREFGKKYHRAIGTLAELNEFAEHTNHKWVADRAELERLFH